MAGKYQRESHENLHGKDERKIDTKSNRACHETDVIRYHGKKADAFLCNFIFSMFSVLMKIWKYQLTPFSKSILRSISSSCTYVKVYLLSSYHIFYFIFIFVYFNSPFFFFFYLIYITHISQRKGNIFYCRNNMQYSCICTVVLGAYSYKYQSIEEVKV